MCIRVETAEGPARGMTLPASGPANAQVTTGLDEPRIRRAYLSTICP